MGVCGRRLDKVRLSALSGGWVRSRQLGPAQGGPASSTASNPCLSQGVRGHFLGVGADFRVGLRPPSPRRSAGQGWARPESRFRAAPGRRAGAGAAGTTRPARYVFRGEIEKTEAVPGGTGVF